ncbi:unnamed protein product [Cyprideis torosa]|uniref:Uncharacterized protein n=1 Tax=Cyprideis torosa TaxID=163714 RepID=A0A7R8W4R0_9CRUS|nr:unnamed protein product [Cyprideis torosa]CAG0879102.1 unnamed protein product [Cyprideis torosa]
MGLVLHHAAVVPQRSSPFDQTSRIMAAVTSAPPAREEGTHKRYSLRRFRDSLFKPPPRCPVAPTEKKKGIGINFRGFTLPRRPQRTESPPRVIFKARPAGDCQSDTESYGAVGIRLHNDVSTVPSSDFSDAYTDGEMDFQPRLGCPPQRQQYAPVPMNTSSLPRSQRRDDPHTGRAGGGGGAFHAYMRNEPQLSPGIPLQPNTSPGQNSVNYYPRRVNDSGFSAPDAYSTDGSPNIKRTMNCTSDDSGMSSPSPSPPQSEGDRTHSSGSPPSSQPLSLTPDFAFNEPMETSSPKISPKSSPEYSPFMSPYSREPVIYANLARPSRPVPICGPVIKTCSPARPASMDSRPSVVENKTNKLREDMRALLRRDLSSLLSLPFSPPARKSTSTRSQSLNQIESHRTHSRSPFRKRRDPSNESFRSKLAIFESRCKNSKGVTVPPKPQRKNPPVSSANRVPDATHPHQRRLEPLYVSPPLPFTTSPNTYHKVPHDPRFSPPNEKPYNSPQHYGEKVYCSPCEVQDTYLDPRQTLEDLNNCLLSARGGSQDTHYDVTPTNSSPVESEVPFRSSIACQSSPDVSLGRQAKDLQASKESLSRESPPPPPRPPPPREPAPAPPSYVSSRRSRQLLEQYQRSMTPDDEGDREVSRIMSKSDSSPDLHLAWGVWKEKGSATAATTSSEDHVDEGQVRGTLPRKSQSSNTNGNRRHHTLTDPPSTKAAINAALNGAKTKKLGDFASSTSLRRIMAPTVVGFRDQARKGSSEMNQSNGKLTIHHGSTASLYATAGRSDSTDYLPHSANKDSRSRTRRSDINSVSVKDRAEIFEQLGVVGQKCSTLPRLGTRSITHPQSFRNHSKGERSHGPLPPPPPPTYRNPPEVIKKVQLTPVEMPPCDLNSDVPPTLPASAWL